MSLTTRDDVKEFLKITHTNWDDLIDSLILRMNSFVDEYVGRAIEAADYTEQYDALEGNGGVLRLKNFPVNSVTSLHSDPSRTFDASTLIAAADYVVYNDEGVIRLDPYSATRYVSQPDVGDADFSIGLRSIKVVYNAGYETVPGDLAQAAIELVAFKLLRSDTGGIIKERQLADAKFVYKDGVAVPVDTLATLDRYKTNDAHII